MAQNVVTDQGEREPAAQSDRHSGELSSSARPPRLQRVRLWQAVAGMSAAIALASLIVTSELAKSLAQRTNYVNRRVAALDATVRTLRNQRRVTQRKLGSEHERASTGEVLAKILFSPDLRRMKLAAPGETEKNKSIVQSGRADLPTATLAMSESAGAAMLEASGLKPTGTFEVYRIWWMPKHGVPIWAADFLVGDDGLATVPMDLPPGREMSLAITLQNESYSDEPDGPIALKGEAWSALGFVPGARKTRR